MHEGQEADGNVDPVAGLDSVGGFRALVELSPDAIFVIRDGYHVFANARGLDLLGARTLADLQTRPAAEFMHPDCRPEAIGRMRTMVVDRAALDYVEEKIVRLDGTEVDIEAAGTPIQVDGVSSALVVVRDITARKRAEEELRLAVSRFQAAFRHAPTAILLLDDEGTVTAVNPTLGRLIGSAADALVGRPYWELAAPQDRERVRSGMAALIGGAICAIRGDFRYTPPGGAVGWLYGRAARLPGERTFIVHLVDVTVRLQEQHDLAARALHDPLTGLDNRTAVLDALAAALRPPGAEVAVLFADLDGFKAVNDRFGHPVGDQVLVAVARRMRAAVPSSDPVGRIGGDEFAIVLTGRQAASRAWQVAARIHEAVSRPISVSATLMRVGVSIGIATAHGGQQVSAESLLAAADTAMYQAKNVARRHQVAPDGAAGPGYLTTGGG